MASAGRFQLSSRLSKLTALYGSLSGSSNPQRPQIFPSEDTCDNMAPAPPLPAPAHVVVHEPPVTREEMEATHLPPLEISPVQPASYVHGDAVPPPAYLPLQPVPIEQPFVDQGLQTQRVRQEVDVAAQSTDQPAHRVLHQKQGYHKLRTLPHVLDDVMSNLHKDKAKEWEEARNSFKNKSRVKSQTVIDALASILGAEAGHKVWKKAKADFKQQYSVAPEPQDDPASASEQHVSSPMEGCADPSTAQPESVATESRDQASPRPRPPSSSLSLSPQLPTSSLSSSLQPPASALQPTADGPPSTSPPQEHVADRHDDAKRTHHRGAHEQKLKRMALKARALITWQASVYKQTMEWHDKILRPMYLTNAGWTCENLSEGKSRIVPPTDWYFTPDGERRRILPLELKHEGHFWKTPEAAVEGAKRELISYEEDPRDESLKSRPEPVASSSVVMAPGIDTCKGVRPMWPARLMTKEETENYIKANNLTEPDYVPNDDVVVVLLCWNLHHYCTVVKRGQCRRVTLEDLDEMCRHWKAEVSGEGSIVGLGRPIVGPQATVSFLAGLAYAKAFARLAEFVPLELWIANDANVKSFTAEQLSNPWSDTPDENVAQQFPELQPCTKCLKCYGPYTVALALDYLRKDGFRLPSPLPIEASVVPSGGHKRERSQASAFASEPPAEPTAKRYKSARSSARASTTAAGATTTTTTADPTSTTHTQRSTPPADADAAAAPTSVSTTESTGVIDLIETDDDDELRRASSTLPGATAGVLHAAAVDDVKAEDRIAEEGFEGFEEMKESGLPVREETSVVSEETVVGVMHESEGDEMMDMDRLPEILSDEEQLEGPPPQQQVQESITEAQRLKTEVDSALEEALKATCLTPRVELLGLDVMIGGLCTRLEARTLTLRELDVAHGRVVEAVDVLAAVGVEKQQPFVDDVTKAREAFWEAALRLVCSEKAKRHGAGILSLSREKSLVDHLYSQHSTKRAAESLVPLRDALETAIGVLKCEMAGYDTPRENMYSAWARLRLCLHRAISRSTRTLMLADRRSADHAVPLDHVEQPARHLRALSAIKTVTLEYGRQFKFQQGVTTTYFPILDHPFKRTPSGFINEVLRGHAAEYLSYLSDRCGGSKIERISVDGSDDDDDDDRGNNQYHSRAQGGVPNGDTFGNSNSFIAASVGLAGSLEAVDSVVRGDCRNAFVACRPPGHHALRDGRPSVMHANDWKYGLGFCLLNMVACAAKHCIEHWGLRRVTVVDIDLHHGNGTEEILCHPASRAYQYISIHLDRIYPGTGKKKDSRPPHSVNLVVEDEFMKPKKFRSHFVNVRKHVDVFRPDMILVSAGYDAHRNDPLGYGGLTAVDFHFAFKELQAMADVHCGGRLCAVMEGGYCCSMEHAATARAKRITRGGEYAISTDDQECNPEGADSETIQDCIIATCKALAGLPL